MSYEYDIFYSTQKLSILKKKELLRKAKELSYTWWVDKHDDSKTRKLIKGADFEETLNLLNKSCHFVVIHRKGYEEWKAKELYGWHGEIGFCTMKGLDTFLWINTSEENFYKIIDQFKLKPLEIYSK